MRIVCMLVLIVLFEVTLQSGQLEVNFSNAEIFTFKKSTKEIYTINLGEETRILTFPFQSSTIGIELYQTGGRQDGICSPVEQGIIFAEFNEQEQSIIPVIAMNKTRTTKDFQLDPHRNDPGYFLSNPILVNMVPVTEGLASVTSDHRLIVMSVTQSEARKSGYIITREEDYDFAYLRPSVYEHSTPQIVYDPISDYIFLIYQEQIICGQITSIVVNASAPTLFRNVSSVEGGLQNNRSYIGNVRISAGNMFVPVGNDGLDIYKILPDGDLEFRMSLNSSDIHGENHEQSFVNDVAIGGPDGRNLYVLDRFHGVTLSEIYYDEQIMKVSKNEQFGLIPIKYGKVLKEYNDANLFILCERGRDSRVEELGINQNSYEWYQLRTHFLSGRYFDIDVTERFAILRGVDAHRIIYHSIWQGFQPTHEETGFDSIQQENQYKLDEEYLFLPKLQSIMFYSDKFGFGDPTSWHFNQTHPILLGMTTHNIVELPFIQMQPYIRCRANQMWQQGQQYDYTLFINTTTCEEKKNALVIIIQISEQESQNQTYNYLHECVYMDQFSVMIVSGVQMFSFEQLFSMIVGITLVLIVVSIVLAHVYNNYKKKKAVLTSEISGFENKGYSVDQAKEQV